MVSEQQQRVYEFISERTANGIKRSDAIREYSQQHGRGVDAVRRDYNIVCKAGQSKGTTWRSVLENIRQRTELITVMHLCDVHFPHHSQPALELAYQMVTLHQPDVVVIGSDEFDLDLLSSYDADADRWDETPDVIDSLRALHDDHVSRITTAAPKAALLFINGNHEERYSRWVNNNAPKLRNTLAKAWEEMIESRGRVQWVNAKELEICSALLIRHGDRHNIHAAKSLIEQEGYQVSVMAGHTHRPQEFHAQGRRYGVVGVTSGCLSTLTPKYLHGKPSNWKHGTAVGRVHHPTGCIAVENVTFFEDRKFMTAITGKEMLRTIRT